ncbi:hypothetical protein [Streptomyces sp. E-08]|uniref:hypothetical protein n=1 Tax=Streptomyces sp. E-08 TaxID=3404047 RepID=UPI003CE8CD77
MSRFVCSKTMPSLDHCENDTPALAFPADLTALQALSTASFRSSPLSRGAPRAWWLLAGASLLISVQQGIHAPGPDAHLVFTALAPLLIACGAALEGRHENSPPSEWIPRRSGAIGFLGMQFALTLVAGLLYALMISEGSDAPPSKALPPLPPGISMGSILMRC